MKLAILHPSLAIKGGAENLVVWMAGGLAGRGHDVTLFTTDYRPEMWDEDIDKLVEIVLLRPGFITRVANSTRVTIMDYGNQLSRLLRGFDIIICSLFPSHLWLVRAKERNAEINGRIIWYVHEPSRKIYWNITDRHLLEHAKYCQNLEYNEHLRKCVGDFCKRGRKRKKRRQISWDRNAVKRMDLILANSHFNAENMANILETPVEICYPGIPTRSGELNNEPGEYLLAVASLRDKKNVRNIIEALHILSAERGRKEIKLRIVGQGPDRGELEELVLARDLAYQVEFLGYCDDRELNNIYRKARLSIYIPIDEPFGLIALESMYHGTPPIVSDHGGVSEIVLHGETGLLVNPFDPTKIADAIDGLWDDEEKIRKMGAAGRRRVEAQFTQRHFLGRLEAFLQQNDKFD